LSGRSTPAPSPALHQILDLLWLRPGAGGVQVTWGADTVPGWDLVEEYAVVPRADSARFVVALHPRRAAWRSVIAYNRLRAPRTRLLRAVTSVILLLGLERLTGVSRLRVWRDPAVTMDVPTLREHLARRLDVPDAQLAFGVHDLDPNYKPTLNVVGPSGRPVAFAKVGWSTPTARLVSREGAALARIGEHGVTDPRVSVPALLEAGSWSGLALTVVSPMPSGVRRYPGVVPPPAPALPALAGPLAAVKLVETPWWATVDAALAGDLAPDVGATCAAYAEALSGYDGVVSVAEWHGDWVPWNLALEGERLHVFDWEHSAAGVPWGFDLAHWSFQVAFVLQGHDARTAVATVDRESAGWAAAGVDVPDPRLVASAYLLEMALRTERLQRDDGTWNARLFPDLFRVLDVRRSEGLWAISG
jgi:hypothetical protein